MLALESIDAKLGRIADACERADERMRVAGVGSLESQAEDESKATPPATFEDTKIQLPTGLVDAVISGEVKHITVQRRVKRGRGGGR